MGGGNKKREVTQDKGKIPYLAGIANYRNIKWKQLHRQQVCRKGSGKDHIMI